MKEQQLELDLDLEPTYEVSFTESELNTISLLLSFVDKDEIVDNIHNKLNAIVDESLVEDMLETIHVRQHCVEEGSFVLPKEDLNMYDNGYVLKIKD